MAQVPPLVNVERCAVWEHRAVSIVQRVEPYAPHTDAKTQGNDDAEHIAKFPTVVGRTWQFCISFDICKGADGPCQVVKGVF